MRIQHVRTPRGALTVLAVSGLLVSPIVVVPAPAAAPCTAPPATFPTSQMRPGMVGTGYTVIDGRTIVPFSVEILGVMPDAIFLGVDIVAARITGPSSFLNVTGGAVAGMSGSPVYIDGRLAGAVAWAIAEDRRIFGMTAAEDMVGLLTLPGSVPARASTSVPLTPKVRRAASATGSELPAGARLEALPVPLGVSGLSGRVLADLESAFAERGVRVQAFRAGSVRAPTAVTLNTARFAPGDGLGVALSYGDVSAYGFGTTTAVCGDLALGFGHPMFWGTGRVSLGMNAVDVIAIDNGRFWGTKIGTLGDAHGTLTQDRFAGVVGVFGALPTLVPLTSEVSSPDTGYRRSGRTDVAWDQGWFVAEATFAHAWSNLTYVAQQDAPGTLFLSWTIEGTRADGSPWRVSNRFMEVNDYGAAGEAWRLADVLYALAFNGFERVRFTSVSMEGSITQEDLTSRIVRVRVSTPVQRALRERPVVKARPGDRVTIEVTLDPVERETNVTARLTLRVPRWVRGSERVRLSGGRGGIGTWGGSLDELLANLSAGEARNDLIVTGLGRRIVQAQDVIVTGRAGFRVKVVR